MARYFVPQNVGRVRIAKSVGGIWVVWNGKQNSKHEFSIPCRTREQATEVAKRINAGERGDIDVFIG
ncbi:MAG TPA: hypothetical protein VFE58_09780 [Tepidisphaeraceae bacterium]|jgi:hypothetical protein|nr:hypothetical protein [Tepidisphaeraceae bacterium]